MDALQSNLARSGLDVPLNAPLAVLVCAHRGAVVAEYAAEMERAGFVVETTSTLRQTLERLHSVYPAIVVLDPLASAHGAEVAAVDRACAARHDTALLVVIDSDEPLGAARTPPVSGRAWDVIRRGAPAGEFRLRIDGLRRQLERELELERLRHVATHDDRTDLLRPQMFQDQVRGHFSAAQRHGFDLALLLIDLDEFGRVNKVHDHTVGDRVIARVGGIIRATLRSEDIAGRLGGDEFGVLLPYTRKPDAARVVRRLLDQIRELSAEVLPPDSEVHISASIGFETYDGRDLDSVERLRLNAEKALHRAKREGGDRGVYHRQTDGA